MWGGHLLILDLFVVASGTPLLYMCSMADGGLNQTANIPDYRLLSLNYVRTYFELFEIRRWYVYTKQNSQLEAHCSTVKLLQSRHH